MSSNRTFSMSTRSSTNCNNSGCYSGGPLYNGNNIDPCVQCPPGPTGPPGDKYLSYFKTTFYRHKLFDGAKILIMVDKYLAYVKTDDIFIQVLPTDADSNVYRFYGTIDSYIPDTGIMVIVDIFGIVPTFPFGQLRTFLVNIDSTGSSLPIDLSGIGSIVVINPENTSQIYYNNSVSVDLSSSVIVQGNSLRMRTAIKENVGYIANTPFDISFNYNTYYITLSGACTIYLPQITSEDDGFYMHFRRVYDDNGLITFQSNPTTTNIVGPGTYLTNIVSDYSCSLVDGDTSRTFRVGTVAGTTYWFMTTP